MGGLGLYVLIIKPSQVSCTTSIFASVGPFFRTVCLYRFDKVYDVVPWCVLCFLPTAFVCRAFESTVKRITLFSMLSFPFARFSVQQIVKIGSHHF